MNEVRPLLVLFHVYSGLHISYRTLLSARCVSALLPWSPKNHHFSRGDLDFLLKNLDLCIKTHTSLIKIEHLPHHVGSGETADRGATVAVAATAVAIAAVHGLLLVVVDDVLLLLHHRLLHHHLLLLHLHLRLRLRHRGGDLHRRRARDL